MYQPNLVARLISAAYRHQLAYLSRNLIPHHLSGGSYIYLRLIAENPGITQAEMSSQLMIDRATVSKMLNHLEKEEMISRTPHPTDRRASLLNTTPKGDETFEELLKVAGQYRLLMQKGISDKDLETTRQTLEKIVENIQKASKRETAPAKRTPPMTPARRKAARRKAAKARALAKVKAVREAAE